MSTRDEYISEMLRLVVEERGLSTPVPDDAKTEFREAVAAAAARVMTKQTANEHKDKAKILRDDYEALRERAEVMGNKIATNPDPHFGYRLGERMAQRGLPSPGRYLLILQAAIEEEIERLTPNRHSLKAPGRSQWSLFWAAMNLWMEFAQKRPAKRREGPFMDFIIAFHGVVYGEEYTGDAYGKLLMRWNPVF